MSNQHQSQRYRDPLFCMSRGWPQNAERDAKNGNVDAQLFMAHSHFNNENTKEAVKWYKEAAKQGKPEALCNLAALYLHTRENLDIIEGCKCMDLYLSSNHPEREPAIVNEYLFSYGSYLIGAKTNEKFQPQQELPKNMQDAKKGCELLERSGQIFNNADAIDLLGSRLYMTGQHPDIPQNLEKGMYWLLKGAQNGNGKNAFQLAMAYKCGIIPVNPELEEKWLEVAVKLGSQEAKVMLQTAPRSSSGKSGIGRKKARKRFQKIDEEKDIHKYLTTDESNQCSNPNCTNEETVENKFALCSKCKQAKYCSRDCQVEHWKKGGHSAECEMLEKVKDNIIAMNKNACILEARICFNPACCKSEGRDCSDDEKFKRCSRCKAAIYCSQDCQKIHYKAHKKVCKTTLNYMEEADKLLQKLT